MHLESRIPGLDEKIARELSPLNHRFEDKLLDILDWCEQNLSSYPGSEYTVRMENLLRASITRLFEGPQTQRYYPQIPIFAITGLAGVPADFVA